MSTQSILKEFDEKFVETYADNSSWGVGLRIKSDGTIKDRETLDDIKSFLEKAIEEAREDERKRLSTTIEECIKKNNRVMYTGDGVYISVDTITANLKKAGVI